MSEKEKQIIETFSNVMPKLSEKDKSYLLGLGEGMAIKAADEEKKENSTVNDIVIAVVINENVAKNLDEFNKLLLPKRYLKISYATKEKNVYIEGYIESFEYDHFSNKVKCQISVMCPKPYWRAQDAEVTKMSPVVDLFEFPFSIPAEGIAFSEYVGSMSEYITNPGNVETGVLIDVEAKKKVKNPLIVNATTGQQMKLLIVINEGDHITVNTERGDKSIVLERNGEKTNVLNTLDDTSEWLRLAPGSNRINYNADSGADNMLITIKCPILYGGV